MLNILSVDNIETDPWKVHGPLKYLSRKEDECDCASIWAHRKLTGTTEANSRLKTLMSLPPSTSAEKHRSKKKHRDKNKSKEKPPVTTVLSNAGKGRNEGVDTTWAYQPPDGTVVLDTSQVDEDFDWDSLKDESKELWIVRVPEGVSLVNFRGACLWMTPLF